MPQSHIFVKKNLVVVKEDSKDNNLLNLFWYIFTNIILLKRLLTITYEFR